MECAPQAVPDFRQFLLCRSRWTQLCADHIGQRTCLDRRALPQSAPQIAENIASLGFRLQDVKWIVSSHAHYDHAGGIAALSRKSGARVAASKRSSEGLRSGSVPADDPQVGYGAEMLFPKVKEVRELSDGVELTLGTLRIKVHYTPGHTPGATSYSWQSCEGTTCLHMVYADSLNAVSAPGFRFSAQPMRITEFEQSIEKVKSLPCDVVISAHPSFRACLKGRICAAHANRAIPIR